MIKLLTFYKEIRVGSSLPLIVGGNDGIKYVVKARGSGDGVLASVVEWLSIKLGLLIQIPILKPEFLIIDTSFSLLAQDPEIRELLERSVGINFGTKYVEGVSIFNEQHVFDIDSNLKNNIFLYDLFLLNIDRSYKNTNMIINNNDLWCLDYSSSMTMKSLVEAKVYQQEEVFLREIKKHPFYSDEITANDFIEKIRCIEDKSISDIVEELPLEWIRQLNIAKETKEIISILRKGLIEKKNQVESLRIRLELLKTLEIETDKERNLRTLKNKNSFREKFGKI